MSYDYRVTIAPGFSELTDFISQVTETGLPDDAALIYHSRNTIVHCVRQGFDINIKSFKLPNALNRYVYAGLRKSKAERSFINARRLNEMGFHTPQPVAFTEQRTPGRLHHSYYFSLQVDAAEVRSPELQPDCDALLRALGREMARLHRAGVWMKDFSPGNVLFARGDDGSFTFSYVDLNRIEFGVSSPAKLMRMFGAMVYTPEHMAALVDGYADEAGADRDSLLRRALARMDAWQRRNARWKRFKKLFRKKH